MKDSKLIEIIKSGNIVIPLYLLKNYKKITNDMNSFIFLMYFYHPLILFQQELRYYYLSFPYSYNILP